MNFKSFFSMDKYISYCNLFIVSCLLLFMPRILEAKDFNKNSGRKLVVYIKGDSNLIKYFKNEFNIINYANDPAPADVQILLLNHSTANEGVLYRMIFTGQNDYTKVNDALEISFQKTDSEKTINDGLLKALKIGLLKYFYKTKLINQIKIKYPKDLVATYPVQSDNWDYWLFDIGISGSLDAEESRKDYEIQGEIEASRITEESKLKLSFSLNNKLQLFEIDGNQQKSLKKGYDFKGEYVKSLGNHFSAGLYAENLSSSFINTKYKTIIAPAVEYNLFPYSESLLKEFTIKYRIMYGIYNYYERTIYGKLGENLWSHNFKIKYELKEVWGSASVSLEGAQYLSDFSKNSLTFDSGLSVRIFEGFSINTELNLNILHDQIYLSAEGASVEEILLNQKQLASQYELSIEFGFSYSFGSIFNNIVNTRF
jgi:hypothetical protein